MSCGKRHCGAERARIRRAVRVLREDADVVAKAAYDNGDVRASTAMEAAGRLIFYALRCVGAEARDRQAGG